MVRALLRLDFRQLWRERTIATVLALTLATVFYATWSGARWHADRLAELAGAARERNLAFEREAAQLEDLDRGALKTAEAGAAGLPNSVSTEFLLPPGALSGLSVGEADLRPGKATITAVSRASDMFRFYQVDNPALLALGRFDLAFVVVYLMPLLILGMSYGVLSADRESGSLPLLLSQPLTAGKVAWVRILLRSGLVCTAVLVGGCLGWVLFSPVPLSAPAILRLCLWGCVVLAYGAFWAMLAGLVVAENRSSDGNALVLLLSWAVLTLLLPSLIALVVQGVSPAPSRMAYITAARAAENAANQQGRELVQGYLMDHPELEVTEQSAVAPFVKTFVLVQQRVEDAVGPVRAEFERRLNRQQRLGSALALLSPASLAQNALVETAGSSLTRHQRFTAQAEALRQRWLAALEGPIMADRRLSAAEFASLPRPAFQEKSLSATARAALLPVLVLVLYSALVLAVARRRFRRFSVAAGDPR